MLDFLLWYQYVIATSLFDDIVDLTSLTDVSQFYLSVIVIRYSLYITNLWLFCLRWQGYDEP